MACDGLWDYVEEDEVATNVYNTLQKNNGKYHFCCYSWILMQKTW